LTSTSAIAETGVKRISDKKIIHKNFFIESSPFLSEVAPPVTGKNGVT